jgi:hypothetical protein
MFNATFDNVSVISWWRKPEKTTDLPQITDKHFQTLWKSSDQYLSFIHGLTRLVKKEKHQWINYTKKVVLCLAFLMGLYSQINYNGFYMGYSGRMILDLQLPITTNVVSSNTVSIIIVICICPPGALIWLINLFLFLFWVITGGLLQAQGRSSCNIFIKWSCGAYTNNNYVWCTTTIHQTKYSRWILLLIMSSYKPPVITRNKLLLIMSSYKLSFA